MIVKKCDFCGKTITTVDDSIEIVSKFPGNLSINTTKINIEIDRLDFCSELCFVNKLIPSYLPKKDETPIYLPKNDKPPIYLNNLEDKEILSDEIFNAISEIIQKIPSAVFGGSIALNGVGLIKRKIHDIDLFVSDKTNLSKSEFFKINKISDILSETVTDVNGKPIDRIGLLVGDTKVCCFKVPNEELLFSKISFRGITINIQNVNMAIAAKMSYAKNSNSVKHIEDLNYLHSIIDNILD